jgi:hypothetical protein
LTLILRTIIAQLNVVVIVAADAAIGVDVAVGKRGCVT